MEDTILLLPPSRDHTCFAPVFCGKKLFPAPETAPEIPLPFLFFDNLHQSSSKKTNYFVDSIPTFPILPPLLN